MTACALVPASTAPGLAQDREPLTALLSGSFRPESTAAVARLDPRSLARVTRVVPLGEYSGAWSVSPDRSKLALSTAHDDVLERPRGSAARSHIAYGTTILQLHPLRRLRGLKLGWTPSALVWTAPDRIVAYVRDEFVVADPEAPTDAVRARIAIDGVPEAWATTSNGFAVVLRSESPRLAVFDTRGAMRTVEIGRAYGLGSRLAVDSGNERAFVVARRAPVAEVNLRTLEIHYRNTGSPIPDLADGRVAYLGDETIALAGGRRGAGIRLLDTRTWTLRVVDARARAFTWADGLLLTYDGVRGLKGLSLDGSVRFRLFGSRFVERVQVVGGYAYVRLAPDAARVYVVDLGKRRVVRSARAPRGMSLLVGTASVLR